MHDLNSYGSRCGHTCPPYVVHPFINSSFHLSILTSIYPFFVPSIRPSYDASIHQATCTLFIREHTHRLNALFKAQIYTLVGPSGKTKHCVFYLGMSCRVMKCHVISYRVIWCHMVSCHIV